MWLGACCGRGNPFHDCRRGAPIWDKIGGLLAFAVIFVLPIGYCVYTGVTDEDHPQTALTCDDEDMREFCENPSTVAGFFSLACGRDRTTFTLEAVLGSRDVTFDPTVRDLPREVEAWRMVILCEGEPVLTLEGSGSDLPSETVDPFDLAADIPDVLALSVHEAWLDGYISLDRARELLELPPGAQ